MKKAYEFLSLVLDSITEHIAVIDDTGEIKFVNKSWSTFGEQNDCLISCDWSGINYIDECNKAAKGIREVMAKKSECFYFECPCHSPAEPRWFMMRGDASSI